MIFMYTIDAVLARRKTQTRRVIYPGDRLTRIGGALAVVTLNGRPRWIVNKTYTIHRQCGAKAEPGIRVKVTGLSRDPNPLAISRSDAIAEGFESPAAFVEHWRSHTRGGGDPCWKIEFEVVEVEQMASLSADSTRYLGRASES
jgi:hypothetical protein